MPSKGSYRPPHIKIGKEIHEAFRKLNRTDYKSKVLLSGRQVHDDIRRLTGRKIKDSIINGSLKNYLLGENGLQIVYINHLALQREIEYALTKGKTPPLSIVCNESLQAEFGLNFDEICAGFQKYGIGKERFRRFLDTNPRFKRGVGDSYYVNPLKPL